MATEKRVLRVLFVEDCEVDVLLAARVLQDAGYEVQVHVTMTREEFSRAITAAEYDVVLCDYGLPGWTGRDVLCLVRESGKELPVVLLTGTLGEEIAVEMIKLGAADFVLKERLSRLPVALERAMRERTIRRERSQVEEQLRQALKMEAVGRLAGGVAHDFNNLLNVIIGYSDLMLERSHSPEFLEKSLREVRKASDRAARLTRQLLAFSRQQVMEPRVLQLNEVTSELKDLLRRMIGEDIELVVKPGAELGRVRADPGQVGQVIMNMAANSRDAMPGGGRFTIETSNVYLDETCAQQNADLKPGPYVLMAVSDTGCGMDTATLSHIFEPFFTTKEKGKGTGLGLATVYGIVKQSGGYVCVESEPGRGTTFKIYLPQVDENVEPRRAAADSTIQCQGTETILVVEDEEGVRCLVRECLGMHGYELLEAREGQEALQFASDYRGEIHLMITDVIMPHMNGRELATRMLQVRPRMKVLYISGYAESVIQNQGVLGTTALFLQKPFGPAELAKKVREILDRESGDP